MGRESRETWSKRVARWRSSGLTAKEFAGELGISPVRLQHWAWRLRRDTGRPRGGEAPAAVPALQVVEVVGDPGCDPRAPTAEPYEIITSTGLRIRVPAGFEPESLRRLLAAVSA